MAAEAQPFLAVIDPDNTNFLHPGNMPEKIRAFCQKSGQAVPQTPGEVVRLTLESLALKYRLVLSRLEELIGKRLEPIHIIGGGAKNSLLNQLTADCTGRTVVAGPSEATAIGNILVQALALGHIESLSLARALVRRSFALKIYQPIRDDGWDEGLAKLQTLINSDLP
jgi:rhamnulokinase